MKTAILASLVASATAFAPASVAKTGSSLKAFENELGAQPPVSSFFVGTDHRDGILVDADCVEFASWAQKT